MAELPGESEGAEIIELFPTPKPSEYELAERADLSPLVLKVLLMRGLVDQPDINDQLSINNPDRTRRFEGKSVITSLRAIEEAALAALKEGRDRL